MIPSHDAPEEFAVELSEDQFRKDFGSHTLTVKPITEIAEWLAAHCEVRPYLVPRVVVDALSYPDDPDFDEEDFTYNVGIGGCSIVFTSLADAVAFKLRWS